jgi:hypothetical protein
MPQRHDLAQNYAIKAAIEQLLGQQAWLDLKETTSVDTWRSYIEKVIEAVEVSIDQTVEVRDEAWLADVLSNLAYGREAVGNATDVDTILSAFTATLLRQVFLQIGFWPDRQNSLKVTLAPSNWRLNQFRNVQYVQTPKQVEALFWTLQQKKFGVERQRELCAEYKASESELPYSKWCETS